MHSRCTLIAGQLNTSPIPHSPPVCELIRVAQWPVSIRLKHRMSPEEKNERIWKCLEIVVPMYFTGIVETNLTKHLQNVQQLLFTTFTSSMRKLHHAVNFQHFIIRHCKLCHKNILAIQRSAKHDIKIIKCVRLLN
jgi:hypothetical protein